MATKSVKREGTGVDPMFFIPEGVDELEYLDEESSLALAEDEDEEFFTFVDEESEDDSDVDYGDAPETPTILGIVPPQIIRMASDGSEVVDVVFEVEEVNADDYEFRVTKI
jgi:hypothetical protein